MPGRNANLKCNKLFFFDEQIQKGLDRAVANKDKLLQFDRQQYVSSVE